MDSKPFKEAARTNVTYTGKDGKPLAGFLAKPVGKGPFPGVVLVHEWWGLSSDIAVLAQRLSQEGFVVLAPDTLRGAIAQKPEEAMALLKITPYSQIAADLDAAFEHLISRPEIEPQRVGSAGFCYGGRQSMLLGTRHPQLKATVTLYGSGLLQTRGELGFLGKNGPVLGIFGDQDGSISADQRKAFQTALHENSVSYTETVYAGVGHAFVKSTNLDQPGPPQEAWRQMVAFLKKNLAS